MLSGSDGLSKYDLHKMDPETQARLGALFEAAGKKPSLLVILTVGVLTIEQISYDCETPEHGWSRHRFIQNAKSSRSLCAVRFSQSYEIYSMDNDRCSTNEGVSTRTE